jgi:hypothetical protein
MSREDRRWCLGFSGVLALVTSIPYILAFAAQGSAWRFTGFLFGVEDGNSYIAKMLQGAQGAWLFRTPYASHVGSSVFAFLPYLLLGKLAAGPEMHLQLVALFHLARLLLIPVAVVAVYRFASLFIVQRAWRRWATILVVVGGGLGWLLLVAGQSHFMGSLPLELYSPEAFGFLAYLGLPHLVLAKALLLLSLTAYLKAPEGRGQWLLGGGYLLLLAVVQPLTVVSAYAAIGAHLAVMFVRTRVRPGGEDMRPWLSAGLVALLLSFPLVAYYALGSRWNPDLRVWTAQNVLPSPNPVHYLIAYGILLVPAWFGVKALMRKGTERDLFLPIWFVLLVLLAYAPVTYQRRLVEGAWVALCVLGAAGLESVALAERSRWRIGLGIMGASMLTTLVILGGGLWSALHPASPQFVPAGEVHALTWLSDHAPADSVVLASFETGNILPAWAPVRSVMGHGPETPNLASLRPRAEAVFKSSEGAQERGEFLTTENVAYLFIGPAERALGNWDPQAQPGFTEVYQDGGYAIFAVGAN